MPEENLGQYYYGVGVDLQEFEAGMKAAISQLEQSAKMMADTMQNAVQKIEGTYKQAQIDKEAEKIAKSQTQAAEAAKKAAEDIKAAWGAVGLAIVTAFNKATKATIEHEQEIMKLSRVIGMSTDSVSKLAYAANYYGVSNDNLARSMSILSRNLVAMETSSQKTKSSFEKFGITVKDSSGKLLSADQIIYNIADKFKSMPNGIEKTGMAMSLFGRNGSQMIPILNKGSEGLKQMGLDAQKLGLVVDETASKEFQAYNEATKELNASAKGLSEQIGEVLLPIFTAIKRVLDDLIRTFDSLDPSVRKVIISVTALSGAVLALKGGLSALAKILGMLGFEKVSGTLITLGTKFGWVGWAILGVIGVLEAGKIIWQNDFFGIQESTKFFITKQIEAWKNLWDACKAIFSGIANLVVGAWQIITDPMHIQKGLNTMKKAVGDFMNAWKDVGNALKNSTLSFAAPLANTFEKFQSGIKGYYGKLLEMWNNLFNPKESTPPPGENGDTGGGFDDGGDNSTPYEHAKNQYEQALAEEEIKNGKATAQTKEQLYKQYLENVEKSEKEKTEYLSGLAELETDKTKEQLEAKKAALDISLQDEKLNTKQAYEAKLAGLNDELKVEKLTAQQKADIQKEIAKTQKEYDDFKHDMNSKERELEEKHKQSLLDIDEDAVKKKYDLGMISEKEELEQIDKIEQAKYESDKRILEYDMTLYANDLKKVEELKKKLQQLNDEREKAHKANENAQSSASTVSAANKVGQETGRQHSLNNIDLQEDEIRRNYDAGSIKEADEIQQLQTLEAQKYEIKRQALEQQLSLAQQGSEQEAQIQQQLQQLDDEFTRQKIENTHSLAQAMVSTWTGLVDEIKGLSDDLWDSLKEGSLTLKGAFSTLTETIAKYFYDMGIKIVANWAKSLIVKRTQTAASDAIEIATEKGKYLAITAAGAAAATAMVAANTAAFSGTLGMISAMATAISSIVPVGPAMAAAMMTGVAGATAALTASSTAATAGITAAATASIPSFDVGAWELPFDTLAMVHKREMIVPANFADKARALASGENNGTGGGDTYQININSPDAKAVKRLFEENGDALISVLKQKKRQFAF